MIDSREEFWNAFLATFSKKTLEPAFKAGWATFMALESPEAQEEFTRIATGLKITPRQLRKMAPRRRAQLLLPQLTPFPLLMPCVTDSHYRHRRGPSVSRFLDLAGVPHDEYNVVPKTEDLPHPDVVQEAVSQCMAEQRSVLAIYRYLTVQSGLVSAWGHASRPAIRYLADTYPNISRLIDDDRVEPPTPASERKKRVAALAKRLSASRKQARYTPGDYALAQDMLAECPDHGMAARLIGRYCAHHRLALPDAASSTPLAADWMCVAYLVESLRCQPAFCFHDRARTLAPSLATLAGRGAAPAAWAARELLAALWAADVRQPVAQLLASAFHAVPDALAWRALDWAARARLEQDDALEQRLLNALEQNTQSVGGEPIDVLGEAVCLAQARAHNHRGAFQTAATRYARLPGRMHTPALELETALNALGVDRLSTWSAAAIALDDLETANARAADIAPIAPLLKRLTGVADTRIAGPAACLLAWAAWPWPHVTAPAAPDVVTKLAEACRGTGDSADTVYSAHARLMLHMAAYTAGRNDLLAATPLAWPRLQPLVGQLDVDSWHTLFDLADQKDRPTAKTLVHGFLKNDIDLAYPATLQPHYLQSARVRAYWQRRADATDWPVPAAIRIQCALVTAFLACDAVQPARDMLDRLEEHARIKSAAPLVAQWLAEHSDLEPAWSRRSVLWMRLRLARRTADHASLPTLLIALFYEIRNSEPFAANELVALARDWGHGELSDRLAHALTQGHAAGDYDVLDAGSATDTPGFIVFIGGNEIQARRDAAVRAELEQLASNVTVAFHHIGWDGNWARRLDTLLKECDEADAVVLMPHIRTQFGRAVRSNISCPWVSCPGTGKAAMLRSIRYAAGLKNGRSRQRSLQAVASSPRP
ncbi:hypothetical protein [Salinisphaera japonica]|uniref:Uncharacterized protein n=1 Tax=Salinisphaera japonica YTM-1 TaxID=1209778 RepID=A0A423Q1H9_9GAMM|nr:hypothetical protein [Salinisphaera japonica]ROO32349.1 hypothetical protein SAJA_01360 [Salinisphaera japonica YTM-1]